MNLDSQNEIARICSSLTAEGYTVRLCAYGAIDKYLALPSLPCLLIETNANIADLAMFIENLRFPGMDIADGALDVSEGTCYFRCVENGEQSKPPFPILSFAYDFGTSHFLDPQGVYPVLRKFQRGDSISLEKAVYSPGISRWRLIMDASLLLARYAFDTVKRQCLEEFAETLANCPAGLPPGPEMQRTFLSCLLVSPKPDRGFNLLKYMGLLQELWPELAALDNVDHSKEFHPEGNVWSHTMETFRHRKPLNSGGFDLRLSLGLLLHDAGKPIAASSGSRRFDGHAELGARAAARFLERLDFEPALTQDIFYLVKNHMLPAAIKRLPLTKTSGIMVSPLFPTLMELYRCDESSSFKGLDNFYENSAAYQNYLKNSRNPYRSSNGKKTERNKTLTRDSHFARQ